jgi:hypothetical protein
MMHGPALCCAVRQVHEGAWCLVPGQSTLRHRHLTLCTHMHTCFPALCCGVVCPQVHEGAWRKCALWHRPLHLELGHVVGGTLVPQAVPAGPQPGEAAEDFCPWATTLSGCACGVLCVLSCLDAGCQLCSLCQAGAMCCKR